MSGKGTEEKYKTFDIETLNSIKIKTKNYRVRIVKGNDRKIIVHYVNNQFRSMIITQSGNRLYMEEKMAVTFYEFFRFMELIEDNELLIEIPETATDIIYDISTGVTSVVLDTLVAKQIEIKSSTGELNLRNVEVNKRLSCFSSAGKIYCYMSGSVKDYKIDCHVNRKDRVQPYFEDNPASSKSIVLYSGMYTPELTFASD